MHPDDAIDERRRPFGSQEGCIFIATYVWRAISKVRMPSFHRHHHRRSTIMAMQMLYVSFTSGCTGVNVCDTNQIARRRFKAVETVVRALAPSVELSKESGFFLIIGGIQVAMVRNGSKNPGFIIYIYSQTYKTLYNVKLIFEQNIKSAEMTLVCQLNLSRRHDHTTDRLGNTNASATPT